MWALSTPTWKNVRPMSLNWYAAKNGPDMDVSDQQTCTSARETKGLFARTRRATSP